MEPAPTPPATCAADPPRRPISPFRHTRVPNRMTGPAPATSAGAAPITDLDRCGPQREAERGRYRAQAGYLRCDPPRRRTPDADDPARARADARTPNRPRDSAPRRRRGLPPRGPVAAP